MVPALFVLTASAELLACGICAFSLFYPDSRIWPAPKTRGWQSYLMWALFLGSAAGVFLLGALDWGSSYQSHWIRFGLGLPVWLIGLVLSVWSSLTLGVKPTFGTGDELVLRGPYALSRNPQYLGNILALIGWALMSASIYTGISALAAMLAFYLASMSEERFLSQRYGGVYGEYLRRTPRFLPIGRRRNTR